MRSLAQWPASRLVTTMAVWTSLVLVGWLFTPGGQAVLFFVQLAFENPGGFNAELPLDSMRFWAIAAALVATVPSSVLFVTWRYARRSVAGKAAA